MATKTGKVQPSFMLNSPIVVVLDFTSHQNEGHMKMEPWFKVSSKRLESPISNSQPLA